MTVKTLGPFISLICGITTTLLAQAPARITAPINESVIFRVPGSRHPLAIPANDSGRAEPGLPLERILLLLKRSASQQTSLDQFLEDQQNPGSPHYQQWVTPEQFGHQFGPAQEDLDAVTRWLESHGFQVNEIANGRTTIEFSGSARQVEIAFHTEMHRYRIHGVEHIANSIDIAMPASVAPVVAGVVSLHSFRKRPLHRAVKFGDSPGDEAAPEYTSGSGNHYLSPYDFAAIYGVLPLWSAQVDGTGQSIAIVGRTNINLSDVTRTRSTYGLPGNNTQIILNGNDPGIIPGEEAEAVLDVTWSGAVAKGAAVKLVISKSTNTSDGVDLSSQYIVNHNVAPVMSVSFGQCEAGMGSANQFYNSLWSQAAAQGISVFVSAGDDGSAGCDDQSDVSQPATGGFAVSGVASTPYNVAVGGTQFNDTASPSSYWNFSNDSNLASAKGYIPEVVWNESSFTTSGAQTNGLWAGSGGVSSVYATPTWQTGGGVPVVDPGTSSQHHRYLPDVALASAAHDGYLTYLEGQLYIFSGTSAAAPSMAGIMAMINQYTGTRNGNPNPRLYSLAATAPAAFHDVSLGSNAVPCAGGSPNCTAGGLSSNIGQITGYNAAAGYDLASGWGSVNAMGLAANWATPGATRFTISAPASAVAGTALSFTVTALNSSGATVTGYAGTVHFTSTDGAATLPANTKLSNGTGTFSATLKTPGSQAILAGDTSNSSISGISAPIAVTAGSALPDLVVTSVTGPFTAIPGEQINVNITIANQGNTAAGPFLAESYFSTSPVISMASIDALWGCQVNGLAAGAAASCSGTVVVPLSLTPGTWYLGTIADPSNAVTESNKSNNSRAADSGPLTVPASAKSQSYVGVFRGGQWHLDMSVNPQWAPAVDFIAALGQPGDIPVVGDWNGSGTAKIGLFRNGVWYLDKNGNGRWDGPGVDILGSFGQPGDIPVVGDWTGSGTTKVGIFRNGLWCLDKSGTAIYNSTTTIIGSFGGSGDIPMVGDWTGSGTTKVGVFRGGLWYLDKSGTAAYNVNTTIAGGFGGSGDIPMVGDWTGSGTTKVGVFRNGLWYLDKSGTAAYNANTTIAGGFGGSGDIPMVGDWTGSGTTKVGVFRSGTWYLDTSGTANYNSNSTNAGGFGGSGDIPVVGHWR